MLQFAITGITGQVGGVVARMLLDAGKSIRAVVRGADKGAVWAKRGCEIAVAEMADAGALTAAFAGASRHFARWNAFRASAWSSPKHTCLPSIVVHQPGRSARRQSFAVRPMASMPPFGGES